MTFSRQLCACGCAVLLMAWITTLVDAQAPAAQQAGAQAPAGQGHAYAVGASEILSLRDEAKKALGPKFDLKEFHSRVLEDGPITLPMLRDKIRRWIASTR